MIHLVINAYIIILNWHKLKPCKHKTWRFVSRPCYFFVRGYISWIHSTGTQPANKAHDLCLISLSDLSDENNIQNLCPSVPPNELAHRRWKH